MLWPAGERGWRLWKISLLFMGRIRGLAKSEMPIADFKL